MAMFENTNGYDGGEGSETLVWSERVARCVLRTQNLSLGAGRVWPPIPQDACAQPRKRFMGRPKVSNLRDMQLKLNLTATEYECVVRRAKTAGLRPTHFGRAVILKKIAAQGPGQNEPSNPLRLDYLALRSLGNDLNQMVRHVHQTGEPPTSDLESLLADIRQIVDRAAKKWL